jgi:phosphoketolase
MRPETDTLSADELRKMHADWRAANYLSVGQTYLLDNPLLKEPLARAHVKPRLLGHWGDGVTTFAVPNLQRQRSMALRTRSVIRGSFQARVPFRKK